MTKAIGQNLRRVSMFLLCMVGVMVFTLPSQAAKPLGSTCSTHQECGSQRCDNRPAAGCVPQDGTGNGGEFCTTHQQCRTGLCNITPGTYTGKCSGNDRALGQQCVSHQECRSQRCDNRPAAGCVPQDGTGKANDFCTTHQQCRTGFCTIASGKIAGKCSTSNRPLGASCLSHAECTSQRCDNRPAAGCVPQDRTGKANDFCTTHQQCRTGFCTIASGKIAGQCSAGNRPLGTNCSSHGECTSQRCDNRTGAGCVAQDRTGKAGEFCTTHQQCYSGYCDVTSRLRGTCTAGDLAIGKNCHVGTECTSKNCSKGVCAQPKQPPNSYQLTLGPSFNSKAPNRTVYYTGRSFVTPATPKKKAIITSVKNTSQYVIRLTYKNTFGNILGPSAGVGVSAGTATSTFNGYDASAIWEALGPESGNLVGGNTSISIEISWKEQ